MEKAVSIQYLKLTTNQIFLAGIDKIAKLCMSTNILYIPQ